MRPSLPSLRWATLILAGALAATPVLAKDDDGGKHGQKGKHAEKDQRKADKRADKEEHKAEKRADKAEHKAEKRAEKEERKAIKHGAYFDDRHRESVRHYYTSYSGKSCPPGLAKKNNGCMPPGQAKKWHVGQPLPPSVTVYTVPQPILVTLPPPPPRHQYVRVSGDILLIAIGTKLVVDGISGLSN